MTARYPNLKIGIFHSAPQHDGEDREDMTELHNAARDHNVNELDRLLALPATSINALDAGGRTALHYAVLHRRRVIFFPQRPEKIGNLATIVVKLLEAGIYYKLKDGQGNTALDYAVKHDNHRAVEAITTHNPDSISREGELPNLHQAARSGFIEVMKALLSHQINVTDTNGRTALHHAAEMGNLAEAHLLVTAGCEIDKKDLFGRIALHYATNYVHNEGVNTSDNRIDDTDFAGQVHIATTELLIVSGSKVNEQDSSGSTPLHYAARCKNVEMVNLLKEKGCDIGVEDKDHNKAIDYALENEDIVQLLTPPQP